MPLCFEKCILGQYSQKHLNNRTLGPDEGDILNQQPHAKLFLKYEGGKEKITCLYF